MNWYRSLIASAGFANFPFAMALVLPLAFALAIFISVAAVTQVLGLAFALAFISLTAILEVLSAVGRRRSKTVLLAWPEVVENIQSAIAAGLDLSSAIRELSTTGPIALRGIFTQSALAIDSGHRLDDVLTWLKMQFSMEPADHLFELLRLSEVQGGVGLASMLNELTIRLRSDQKLYGELAAKQGWVATMAKLGLIAPWIVVAMLSVRPENAHYYNSPSGLVAMLGGLTVCLGAYLAIRAIAILPSAKRVFTRV